LTQATAAKTCKQAKIHFKNSKNGFYWVTGPNDEFSKDNGGPKKVMCWQTDRDGGGWTLYLKMWYPNQGGFTRSGMGQANNINSGVMAHLVRSHAFVLQADVYACMRVVLIRSASSASTASFKPAF
jgi:hypothetical protein